MIVDLHTHVLPGVDDGPPTFTESLAGIAAAARAGVGTLAATPHVRDDYPTTASTMERLVDELSYRAAAEGLATKILPGAELAADRLAAIPSSELRRFGLGGSEGSLLIEFPYDRWPPNLADDLAELRGRGFRPILAHPERNPEIQAAPGRLSRLVEEGALVQVTALSLSGGSGRQVQRTALRLVELRLAHLVASDMHGTQRRTLAFEPALAKLRDEHLARWLSREVPAAVIGDADIPPRPGRPRRPLWRLR